jgi:D-glycero-alpha-D-manno-heptose 1-phosphate guanylyltransferase
VSPPRVLILAGGLGTRLAQVVKDVPKPMAPISGKPFLEYQIEFLRKQGFREFTLLTGHLSQVIEKHFGDGGKFGVQIDYSVEREPLGTGGAIRQAMVDKGGDRFLAFNGDCLFTADFTRFIRYASLPISLALKYTNDLSRYGSVTIDDKFSITSFQEKTDGGQEGYINAGTYFIDRSALDLMPEGKFSIEQDVFIPLGSKLKGIPCGGKFVDIGTPESFAWSQNHLPAWLAQAPRPCLFVDRDGVLVEHKHYLHKTEDVILVPQMCDVIKRAKKLHWHTVVITNQSGVGRGIFTREQCDQANAHIHDLLAKQGAAPDLWMCSYDHPTDGQGAYRRDSLRRKPKPGMLLEACDSLSIDLGRSLMIGDNWTDQIELPGLSFVLVKGDFELKNIGSSTVVANDFADLKAKATAKIETLNAN